MSLSEPTAEGASEAEAALLVGEVLSGRYRIDQVLGLGGMGAVYRAEHLLMHKRVAIKVLHPEMTRMPEVVARFEREAMAAAHIEHPNVAAATDFGKLEDGSFFLVLEFVEGASLRDEIEKGPMAQERAVHITRQVLMALHRAHGLGIVHRDLKPENVMLVERDGDHDFVKVLDFGIAKVPIGEIQKSGGGPERKPTAALTQLGMVYGTPEYMAPEQALGQDVDMRADLYAMGVLLFEMLTGKRPFDADSPVQILGMVVSMPVPTIAKVAPEISVLPEVEVFTRRLLEKLPADRYDDARAALDALDAAAGISGPPPSAYGGARSGARMPNARASQVSFGNLPTALGTTAVDAPGGDSRPARGLAAITGLPRHVLALVAGGVGVAVLLVIVLVVAMGGPSNGPTVRKGETPGGDPSTGAGGAGVSPIATTTDDDVKTASSQGVSALEALRDKFPRDPRVLRALLRAESEQKRGPQAAAALTALAENDKSAFDDKTVREQALVIAQLEGGDGALTVLEKQAGAAGADVLYDLSKLTTAPRPVQKRATDDLASPELLAVASPALKVTLDLRNSAKLAPGEQCKVRRELFVTAKEVGDHRALPYLRQWTSTKGCGFLRHGDCFACLHVDSSLGEAITAITQRDKKPD